MTRGAEIRSMRSCSLTLAAGELRRRHQRMSPTWLRRVTLDLTGLPATVEEARRFDAASTAVRGPEASRALREAVVDDLLQRRSRAEHRTREWLDLARYADTNGYQNDFRRDQWPWRDWVLNAFGKNMPYDRFITEQVAGDLLESASTSSILATGFARNHRTVTEAGSIDEEWRVENVADRAETTATAFLGLTLACARCHDHKYDPLTQRDYYSFYAFFNSIDEKGLYQETRGNVPPLIRVPSPEQSERLTALDVEVTALEAALEATESRAQARYAAWKKAAEGQRADLPSPLLTYRGQPAPNESPGPTPGEIELDPDVAGGVDLGRGVTFEQDRPFSVSMWVWPESHGAVYSRMDDNDRYRGTDLVLLDDMRAAVHLIHSWTDNAVKVVTERPLNKNAWHHVAVTYDGSKKASGVTVYVDGDAAHLRVERDALDGTIHSDEPFRLGSRRYAGSLSGGLLDVRLDGQVLTAEQVKELARMRAVQPGGKSFFACCFDEETRAARDELRAGIGARDDLRSNGIPTAMVLRDLDEPRETRLLDRGRYDSPTGDVLLPDVPAVFGGLGPGAPRNRLGLARWLVREGNPLTARVAVNRAWAGFFGVGLVATPGDFGVRGDRPEYRALLDQLSADFVASGWDLAGLERRIALSATYAQSSAASAEAVDADPRNRWLARGPRHRLDAEVLRDQALAVSGLLAPGFGGPSVKPYQPAGLWAELAGGAGQGAYVPSKGDDLFRRSVYTYRKRTVPHPTLTTFDAPGFELCSVKRARTNTPMQALAVLNDVTYVEAARHLAERMLAAPGEPEERLAFGFRALLTRAPSPAELRILGGALARHRADFEENGGAAIELLGAGETARPADERTPELAAYTMVASTLLNLDEALTKR